MISINNRDPRPIYEQLAENFRKLIVTGVMQPDEKLPSVRELSGQLAINPNTIQRAYRELESDGYIYSMPGKGSFVCPGLDVSAVRRQELLDTLCRTARELEFLGVTREEIESYISEGGKNL